MALTNHSVTGVRTVYLPCRADRGYISSRFVREIARYGGSVTHMVPQCVDRRAAGAVPRHEAIRSDHMTYDDDEYDDYDDIDDEYPEPGEGYVGDAETLLRRSIDIIATAPTMPLSSSPRIDRDEIIELLEEALQRLPDELRQARWMLKERQEFVAKTRREADELLEAVAGAGRADGAAHRGRAGRRAAGPAGDGDGRGRLPPAAPRDRGLPRPATGQLRDPARQAAEDRRRRAPAAVDRLGADAAGDDVEEDDPTKGFFDQDR